MSRILTKRNLLKSAGTLGAAVLSGQFFVTGQEKSDATDNCAIEEEKLTRFSNLAFPKRIPFS